MATLTRMALAGAGRGPTDLLARFGQFETVAMGTARRAKVSSTDKTTNLEIAVTGDLSLDGMESVLFEVAQTLGMYFSRITILGAKRYPGNRHWHLKQDPGVPGCLDVTYWPGGPLMWISMRRSEPEWVHDAGRRLGSELERRLGDRLA